MNTKPLIPLSVICLSIGLLLVGCVSPKLKVTNFNPGATPPAVQDVKVYKRGETPPDNYEVLGVVTASGIADAATKKSTLPKLRKHAGAMGGDAMIGYFAEVKLPEAVSVACALAVRVLPAGQTVSNRVGDYCVAIAHPRIADEFAKGTKHERFDSCCLANAQVEAAQKGYYAITVEAPMPETLESGFQEMGEAGLASYGGQMADQILCVELVKGKSVNFAFGATATYGVEAALYSKSKKKTTWTSSGSGTGGTPLGLMYGLADLFTPNEKRLEAIRIAVKKAMESLPNISTSSPKE